VFRYVAKCFVLWNVPDKCFVVIIHYGPFLPFNKHPFQFFVLVWDVNEFVIVVTNPEIFFAFTRDHHHTPVFLFIIFVLCTIENKFLVLSVPFFFLNVMQIEISGIT
jgi:hypothetical protein